KYSPDLVLLAVTTNNDVADNSRALKKTGDIPYFVLENNQLTLDNSFRNTRAFAFNNSKLGQFSNWFVIHSRVVQAVIEGQRGIRVLMASRRARSSSPKSAPSPSDANSTAAKTPDAFARSEELGVDNVVYLEPNNPVWNDAWR